MAGGGDAQCGLNMWVRRVERASWETSLRRLKKRGNKNAKQEQEQAKEDDDDGDAVEYEERYINLGAKNSAPMQPGDRIIICTPGGGGWGTPGTEKTHKPMPDPQQGWKRGSHAAREETALQA